MKTHCCLCGAATTDDLCIRCTAVLRRADAATANAKAVHAEIATLLAVKVIRSSPRIECNLRRATRRDGSREFPVSMRDESPWQQNAVREMEDASDEV